MGIKIDAKCKINDSTRNSYEMGERLKEIN